MSENTELLLFGLALLFIGVAGLWLLWPLRSHEGSGKLQIDWQIAEGYVGLLLGIVIFVLAGIVVTVIAVAKLISG